jgi:hypothetical protein
MVFKSNRLPALEGTPGFAAGQSNLRICVSPLQASVVAKDRIAGVASALTADKAHRRRCTGYGDRCFDEI